MPTMRLSRLLITTSLLFASGLPALALSSLADAPHVRVELLVLPQVLSRGETVNAGVYFQIEPGWHIYWKNPGDAGLPPHISWTLPAGVDAGPMQFPAPKRLPLGPLMDFGYDVEVLFPATLNVAKTAKLGSAVLLAKVDWLVCSQRCIPGNAELDVSREVLDHPAMAASAASDVAIFKRFLARLPKPLPVGFKAEFQPSKDGFRLSVETGQKETEAALFPLDQGIVDNPYPQKITPVEKGRFST